MKIYMRCTRNFWWKSARARAKLIATLIFSITEFRAFHKSQLEAAYVNFYFLYSCARAKAGKLEFSPLQRSSHAFVGRTDAFRGIVENRRRYSKWEIFQETLYPISYWRRFRTARCASENINARFCSASCICSESRVSERIEIAATRGKSKSRCAYPQCIRIPCSNNDFSLRLQRVR